MGGPKGHQERAAIREALAQDERTPEGLDRLHTLLPESLIDANVLIDVFRGFPAALEWAKTTQNTSIGIPVIVRAELLLGCRNRAELTTLSTRLDRYVTIHVELQDSVQGIKWYEQFKLSTGLGFHDALIAAMAARLAVPFFTRNIKHFRSLPGVDARKPY